MWLEEFGGSFAALRKLSLTASTLRRFFAPAARPWALILVLLALCLDAGPSYAAEKPTMLGPVLLGYDLDLPLNPTVEQQIAAGKHQIEILREDDATMDSEQDAVTYFNDIAARLIKASDSKPAFPIFIHVSTEPITNAEALPGGQIVVYSHIFDLVDDEAELVSILAHEVSHQLHGDFLTWWGDYKEGAAIFGKGGVLEQSQKMEAAADETGALLMYQAGWNPSKMVEAFKRLQAMGVRARHGAPTFYSTHPRDPERIAAIQKEIAGFAPKAGLVDDSPKFQELKQKL